MGIAERRLGKYELQEFLGRGGMAEVWKAFDKQLHRSVAIKLLHADLRVDPDFISRFTREAQIIASLHHPNIVQIYDFHISEGGGEGISESDTIAYMVMDYVKGQTMAHYIHKTSHQRKFPPPADIVRLFTPISLAIDYAHQQGMIHRDIKPANILLDSRHTTRNSVGEPILSDFGLAKLLGAAAQTVSGVVSGTPLYISPEQVQNRPVSDQTDIYALGVVLYEMFTGVPPFQGDSLTGIMMQHLTAVPIEPHLVNPQLPPALSEVILKSLAKNPRDRFPSAASMIDAIVAALNLPVPEDLKQAISSMDSIDIPAKQDPLPQETFRMAPSSLLSSDVAMATSSNDDTVSMTSVGTEAVSDPLRLPDSEVQLSAQVERAADLARQSAVNQVPAVAAQTPSGTASAATPSVEKAEKLSTSDVQTPAGIASTPASAEVSSTTPLTSPPGKVPSFLSPTPAPISRKRRWLAVALVAALIVVLVSSGLSMFLLLTYHSPAGTVVTNPVVGHAFFVSSEQVSETTNQGINDEFQIDLQNIPDPQSGKSYYAWLLPDKSQIEASPILLGNLPVNHDVVHFFYAGDSHHSNLLATASRFLITEEDASITPGVPSPDLTAWRYYAELPQTAAPGQTYSLLDHLRHLMTNDPTLEKLHLPGGLSIWAYRNTQKILEWAGSARDDWDTKNFLSMHRQIVSILDYLDGQSLVQKDVPAGTMIMANPQNAQVALLEFDPVSQKPPGYLYHIGLHLNGLLASPGATQSQRNLAVQINMAINNVSGWLEQERRDAVQLVRMSDAQLALPSSLDLLNDLVTQANYAYMGRNNPSTSQLQPGVAQIYLNVQQLATFDAQPYK